MKKMKDVKKENFLIIALRNEAASSKYTIKEVVGDVAFCPALVEGRRATCLDVWEGCDFDPLELMDAVKAASVDRVRLSNLADPCAMHSLDEPIGRYADGRDVIAVNYDCYLFGAGAAACRPAMDKLLDFYGTERLYLAFTSMHECVVHPGGGPIGSSDIKEALQFAQVASLGLAACDRSELLSGNVFSYDRARGLALADA